MVKEDKGCSFVREQGGRVRDFRLYVVPAFQGQGYGFMVQAFVKAYFFPWRSAHMPRDRSLFYLPLGGVTNAHSISLMPSAKAGVFYKRSGFVRSPTSQMIVFSPQLKVPNIAPSDMERAFGLAA